MKPIAEPIDEVTAPTMGGSIEMVMRYRGELTMKSNSLLH
jgi:hypothetical protein